MLTIGFLTIVYFSAIAILWWIFGFLPWRKELRGMLLTGTIVIILIITLAAIRVHRPS